MKKGWQTKNLGDLCEIELGKTPARANSAYWDEKRETGNVWLSIADLLEAKDKIVVDSKEYVSDKGAAICKLVPKGTLLVSFKLTLGRLAFTGRDVFTNEAIAALTIVNERELSKEFLFYCLCFFDWVKAAENDVKLKGMTLNKAKLKVMPVSFPPLAEQQRIVGLLDEAFESLAAAKANAETNLHNARALFDSHLHAVFTQRGPEWVEKKLEEIGRTQTGSTPKTSDQSNYGDFISFVKPGDFNTDGSLDYDKDGLSESGAEGARKVPAGSVLMVCIGATIGKCGYCGSRRDNQPASERAHAERWIIQPVHLLPNADRNISAQGHPRFGPSHAADHQQIKMECAFSVAAAEGRRAKEDCLQIRRAR